MAGEKVRIASNIRMNRRRIVGEKLLGGLCLTRPCCSTYSRPRYPAVAQDVPWSERRIQVIEAWLSTLLYFDSL